MKGNLYSLMYAGILGTVCALLLTAAASLTAPYQEANRQAEERLNILGALNVPLDEGLSAAELVEVFEQNVTEQERGDLTLYTYVPVGSETVEATAVRFAGQGLWGPIKGFLALEKDMRTIRGITFYEQEETPGLGGEIVTESFRARFVGKSIVDEAGKAGILIKTTTAKVQNQVDGLSGATMTCDKVQAMINEVIDRILEENN